MSSEEVRVVTVTSDNVEQEGFFCYKSKKKTDGYANKLAWTKARLEEGMVIHILYEGKRSMGFIEYIPGEYAWRALEAPGYLVIHCLWVVGKGKGKGYASRLLDLCLEDARRQGKHGVVVLTSSYNWLIDDKLFLKHGFQRIAGAPPTFGLLVKRLDANAPLPTLPDDWMERAQRYGPGMTVLYADQCPYMPDAVSQAVAEFEKRGIPSRIVKYENSQELRANAPFAYGTFGIVLDGQPFAYCYLGNKELRQLDQWLGRA